jgi:hypothetical protein
LKIFQPKCAKVNRNSRLFPNNFGYNLSTHERATIQVRWPAKNRALDDFRTGLYQQRIIFPDWPFRPACLK